MKMLRVLVILSLAATTALPAGAQDGPRSRRFGDRQGRRDEIFKMVDAYIAMNLEEALGLTPAEFARVLPLVKALQADRRRFLERRRETVAEMRRAFQSGAATETQIAGLMKELRAVESEEVTLLVKDRNALDDALNVVQQAKYRVLEMEIEQKIRDLARRPRPGAR